ncbi:hypothetical protein diail_2861 [Diaporthe ilicicola]|nr:hypothetical protein diail_2861 [Diaporthe ilicicola]
MAAQATGAFDPNEYYRLTNLALGGEFSLDVDGTKDYPDGKMVMAASGLYTGQIYQILENTDAPGHYFFASSWLGAKEKMDAVINDRGDYAPFLRNFTTDYNQTWGLTPHVDVTKNRTTWTIMPSWFAGGGAMSKVMSVYNDTKQPYLATPGPNPDLGHGDVNQAWFITKEGMTIDDPTYSRTALASLATAAPIVPEGVTPSASATATSTATGTPGGSNDTDHLAGPLIAAAVVPTVTVFISVIAFVTFFCMRRRRARRMARNMPYGSGTTAAASKDGLASEILDTFSAETLGHWRRRYDKNKPLAQSVASSHLSEPRLTRLPEDSEMSINPRANPLRPPPLRTPSSGQGGARFHGRPFFGSSALGLSDDDTTLTSQDLYHMQIEELSGLSPTRKPPWMEERSPSVMEGKGMEVLTGENHHKSNPRHRRDNRPSSVFELENTRPPSRYELE